MRAINLILLFAFVLTEASAQLTKIVWADLGDLSETGGKIMLSNIDGSNLKILVDSLFAPSGIAVDNSSEQPVIYFAERGTDKIHKVDIDGRNKEEVITGIPGIYDIELDLNLRKIFWISDTYSRDAVSRANMDGLNSEIEDLYISTGTFWGYNGLALDQTNQQVFWIRTDNGCEDKIFRMNYDKSNFQIIIKYPENGLLGPRDIDVYDNKIYWTDCGLSEDIIYKANLDGSGIDTVIKNVDTWFFAIDSITNKIFWENNDSIGYSKLDGSGRENIVDNKANFIHGIALAYHVMDSVDTTSVVPLEPEEPEEPSNPVQLTDITNQNQFIRVFPNPADDYIFIDLNTSKEEIVTIELTDLSGRRTMDTYTVKLLAEQKHIQVDVSDLLHGIYFCRIKIKQQSKSYKILIR